MYTVQRKNSVPRMRKIMLKVRLSGNISPSYSESKSVIDNEWAHIFLERQKGYAILKMIYWKGC